MTILSSLFETVGEQLDGIINVYRRIPPPSLETIIWYRDGTVSSYNVIGTLSQSSISNRENIVSVEIGTAITTIDFQTFYNCYYLESIVIQNSVTSIGNEAFFYCNNLSSIVSYAMTAPSVETYTFGQPKVIDSLVGSNNRSTNTNVIKIPQGAIGYDSGQWFDVLQKPTRSNFHIEYI